MTDHRWVGQLVCWYRYSLSAFMTLIINLYDVHHSPSIVNAVLLIKIQTRITWIA